MTKRHQLRLAPPPEDVLLILANRTKLVVPIREPGNSFTYSGRLWVVNREHSQSLGRPVYTEMTTEIITDMRLKANQVLEMADRYSAQIRSLEFNQ